MKFVALTEKELNYLFELVEDDKRSLIEMINETGNTSFWQGELDMISPLVKKLDFAAKQ